MSISTAAFKKFWAAVVTKSKEKHVNKHIDISRHKVGAFVEGQLTNTQSSIYRYEEEVFAIVKPIDRKDHVLWDPILGTL